MTAVKSIFNFKAIYRPIRTTTARYIDITGGRGRGASYFVTDYFLLLLVSPGYFRGYFMRETLNDVRTSLWQDFKDRLADKPEFHPSHFDINDHEMTVTYRPTGNKIISKGFRKSSKKQSAKLKSIAGATHVAIEECEEVQEDDFFQLDDSFRTVKGNIQIIRLFNPPKKNHWLIRNHYDLTEAHIINPDTGQLVTGYYQYTPKPDPQLLSIFSTYEQNLKNLSPTWVHNMESYRKRRPEYYYVTVRGYVSEGAKGRVYSGWRPVSRETYEAVQAQEVCGLDFGFSVDPVAFVATKRRGDDLYVLPLIYETGLSDERLSARIQIFGLADAKTYADPSQPKSIDRLKELGINVEKAPNAIGFGINEVENLNVFYVDDAEGHFSFEYQEYRYVLDAQKNPTTTPEDKFNHYMDAVRYAVTGPIVQPQREQRAAPIAIRKPRL